MANWNSGAVFNTKEEHGGFFWNGAKYVLILRLNETLKVSAEITKTLAKLVLLDKMRVMEEELINTALFKYTEPVKFDEDVTYFALFEVTDKVGITDTIAEILILASLYDKFEIIDDVKMLSAKLNAEEVFNLDEELTLHTFLDAVDSFGLTDLSQLIQVLLNVHDKFGITDGEPKYAISDFIIGVTDDYDRAYDWILPFGMKIDWKSTTVQVMPEASLTTIEMPGIDGSIVEDTVYKDRLFQIVAFSEQGLTVAEKEDLKRKIAEILDSTKHTTKKLTILDRETSFDVKYDGLANITEGPSYVKMSIPLRAGAYGYSYFDNDFEGSGLIVNDGDAPNGPKHTITGPVSNPSFIMDETTYRWNGTVPDGCILVIDHSMMTCYLQDENGVKTNAMSKLTGAFHKIPAHTSVVLNADENTEEHIKTEWHNKYLW